MTGSPGEADRSGADQSGADRFGGDRSGVDRSGGGQQEWAPVEAPLRLSPKVLLTDPIRMLPSLFLPLVGVLFLSGFSPGSFVWAMLGIVGSVVFAAVRWTTFTYRICGDRLELTRALVSRSVRTIPLERIRGVDISAPPLHRVLGIAVLRIDTGAGGDDKQEGELNGVTVTEAERLKAVLLWHARARAARRAQAQAAGPLTGAGFAPGVDFAPGPGGADVAVTGAPGEPPELSGAARAGRDDGREAGERTPDRVVFVLPRRWLLYGPLSGAYLLTPFALVAGAVGAVLQWGGELRIDRRVVVRAGEWLWEHPPFLAGALALLILAMPVLAVIMYAVFTWDFNLRVREDYLVAERGLLTRRSVSLERRRIRGFELVEGPAERRTGLARAWAIVTGLGDSETRGQLLPVVPRDTVLDVAGREIGGITSGLRPHPPAARRRRLFRAVFPWLAVAACAVAAALLWSGLWWALAVPALVVAGLGVPLGLDRYRSLGHAYDGSRLSVRSGSLRRSQAVVERRAVVGWTLSQTWFQRRAGVLTVTAGVGAGSGGYSALDVGAAEGPAFAAEVTPAWIAPFLSERTAPGGPCGRADRGGLSEGAGRENARRG
ncbi:putative membrane protein [Streptosporangium becharense]|uniref:Putative membrane protein n=1 Tax=Streptosporangium becharense TaxID=1816182 RepID=A0A7W9MIT5_9ACTN|nr:PH domain-containing protein [Streptosporangium becharense]MBB2911842.1 putative membrane protein [Streptosporangium becharense]MBB5822340.1 putative membrane protein [Streptosporangium becharense]